MWKPVLLVSALTGLIAGTVIQSTPAEASRAECRQVAKARFPDNAAARRDFKRYCFRQWRAYKAAQRGAVRP
jgi:hypothetical protein